MRDGNATSNRSRALLVVSTLTFLALVSLMYIYAGIDKAITQCGADPPNPVSSTSQATSIEAGWSIQKGGFYCSHSDRNGRLVEQASLGLWP